MKVYKLNDNHKKYTKRTIKIARLIRLLLFAIYLATVILQILYTMPITYFFANLTVSIFVITLESKTVYYRIINNIFGL